MSFVMRNLRTKDTPLFSVFMISVAVSMLFIMIYKSELVLQTGVFSEASLSLIKYQYRNSGSLFLFVCKERLWVIPLLFLLSTTYLARSAVYATIIRYGTGIGTLLAIVLMRYGVGGIFLLIVSCIPQFLLYIPAMVVTLSLSVEKRTPNKRFVMQLILLEFAVIVGCILESYVNLIFLEKILKFFL